MFFILFRALCPLLNFVSYVIDGLLILDIFRVIMRLGSKIICLLTAAWLIFPIYILHYKRTYTKQFNVRQYFKTSHYFGIGQWFTLKDFIILVNISHSIWLNVDGGTCLYCFNKLIYQIYWEIICIDVTLAVQFFFGKMQEKLNYNLIILMHNIVENDMMTDFRKTLKLSIQNHHQHFER